MEKNNKKKKRVQVVEEKRLGEILVYFILTILCSCLTYLLIYNVPINAVLIMTSAVITISFIVTTCENTIIYLRQLKQKEKNKIFVYKAAILIVAIILTLIIIIPSI